MNGRGVTISNLTCSLCQKSLSFRKELENEQSYVVWSCGHCFHSNCFKAAEASNICPQCRLKAEPLSLLKKSKEINHNSVLSNLQYRPDLEGHF